MSDKIEMAINADLKRAMSSFKTAMNKKYADGSGSIFSHDFKTKLPSVSSGSAKLDALLGNDGFVLGRIHEIFGDTGSGKSSIVTMTCANARMQYPDKYILYIDAEQAQSFNRMKALGLDCEKDEGVIFVQEQSAEAVFDIIDNAIKTGGFSLIIVDSIPALMTERELKGDFDKETMAEKARFLSKSIPKILESLKKANTSLIFVNQVRDKMDMWGGVTTPGNMSFYFSIPVL